MDKKIVVSFCLLLIITVSAFSVVNANPVETVSDTVLHPRIVNIVNFIRLLEPRDSSITEEVLYQTVVQQIALMRRYQLSGSFLLQYDALMDTRYQHLLKALPRDSFEIGAWWEIPQPLVEQAGLLWRGRYPWDWRANIGFATGYTPKEREQLADVYMAKFYAIFGYYPKSVGSWFIDAHTLSYLYSNTILLLPAIAKINMARMAIRFGAAIGTRPTIRASLTPICRHNTRQHKYRYPFSGCWEATP